MIFEIGEIVR